MPSEKKTPNKYPHYIILEFVNIKRRSINQAIQNINELKFTQSDACLRKKTCKLMRRHR